MRATCRPRARHGLPERGRPGDRRGRSHPRHGAGDPAIWPRLSPIRAISCVCSRSTAFGRAPGAPSGSLHPPNGLPTPGRPHNRPAIRLSSTRPSRQSASLPKHLPTINIGERCGLRLTMPAYAQRRPTTLAVSAFAPEATSHAVEEAPVFFEQYSVELVDEVQHFLDVQVVQLDSCCPPSKGQCGKRDD